MTSNKRAIDNVPSDFPRPCGGALSGVQNKLIARKIEGRFIVDGKPDQELWVRYDACRDLVTKLTERAIWKRSEYAELSLEEFLRRFRAGVTKKGWDLAADELDWVMRRVAVAMGGELGDVPDRMTLDVKWFALPPVSAEVQVETLVDSVRARLIQGRL
ncbi:hypothetical protein [Paucibacter sp. XJ19-41]|uniref:hypothetical protein n=1 Tax=Paucibacter sp. XJ19-41 TaxID=2927824 RepID=UPI002349749F|nr:hypothetical protein [Paucibacter sp. XJ19-41]MDC6168388.1 hypothetical protein [Paucibacter sp. XJ19-41]